MATNLKNYLTGSVGTSGSTVYNPTTSGIQATVIGFNLSNTTASDVTVDVSITSGATTVYLIKNATIPANNSLSLIEQGKLILEANDLLTVKSSVNSSVDVVISAVEVV